MPQAHGALKKTTSGKHVPQGRMGKRRRRKPPERSRSDTSVAGVSQTLRHGAHRLEAGTKSIGTRPVGNRVGDDARRGRREPERGRTHKSTVDPQHARKTAQTAGGAGRAVDATLQALRRQRLRALARRRLKWTRSTRRSSERGPLPCAWSNAPPHTESSPRRIPRAMAARVGDRRTLRCLHRLTLRLLPPFLLGRPRHGLGVGRGHGGRARAPGAPLSANMTETPAPLGITVGRWR